MSFADRAAKFITNDLKRICREHCAPYPHAVPPNAVRFALSLEERGLITRRETREWIKERLTSDGYSYASKGKKT